MGRIKTVDIMTNISSILSIAKYELIISNIRYPFRVLTRFIGPIIWVVPFLLFGKAVLGGNDSQTLYELTGISHMPTFVLVGSIVTAVSFNILWLLSYAIRLESFRGTFESIYACPIKKWVFFLGKLLASMVWSSFYIIGLIILGWLLLDVQFHWEMFPQFIIITLLLFFAMCGYGLVIAGVMLKYKEGHTVAHFIDGLFTLIIPMAYPLAVLPVWLQKASLALPMTQAVLASRDMLIFGNPLGAQLAHISILLLYALLALPLGYAFYMYMEKKAKLAGTLHKY